MARKRIREAPEVRRAQIVDEGIRIVGELGYYGFTVQALAQRCALTNAGLLHYFGSKDELLLALLDEIERREEEALSATVALIDEVPADRAERCRAVVRLVGEMARRMADSPEQGRFVAALRAESIESSHPAHAWFIARERETRDVLVRLLEPIADDVRSVARQIVAALNGLVWQWLREGQNFDIGDECESMLSRILGCGDA